MVKCADCGMLSYRNPDAELICFDEGLRENGVVVPRGSMSSRRLFCGAGVVDFEETLGPLRKLVGRPQVPGDRKPDLTDYPAQLKWASVDLLQEERECASFVTWRPLLRTPKEHVDMVSQEWRQKFEEDVWRYEKERADALEERAEKWHREEMLRLEKQNRWQLFWFGGAVVLATLLGSVIQAGWLGRPW